MTGPLATLKNRLLSALPSEDKGLIAPHLSAVELEKGRLLYDPGDVIDQVYFPNDCVISLMTLMESGAAIESATVGREGAFGLMAAIAPRQCMSRAMRIETASQRYRQSPRLEGASAPWITRAMACSAVGWSCALAGPASIVTTSTAAVASRITGISPP